MEDKKSKLLIQAKNIFDDTSALFTEEKITQHFFKKLKKSSYSKDKELVNLITNIENLTEINETDKEIIPLWLDYVEKCDIDRSGLHSIEGPFRLVHADVGSLEFLGKTMTHPKHCLAVVGSFTSKIYTYLMKSRRLLAKKLNEFYIEVAQKRNNKKMRLQVNQEFQQNEIKQLNKKLQVEMFSTKVRGGKAFTSEQNIGELKKRISNLNSIQSKSKQ